MSFDANFRRSVIDRYFYLEKKILYFEYVIKKLRNNERSALNYLIKSLNNKQITQIFTDSKEDSDLKTFFTGDYSSKLLKRRTKKDRIVRKTRKGKKILRAQKVQNIKIFQKRLIEEFKKSIQNDDIANWSTDRIIELLDEEISAMIGESDSMLSASTFCSKVANATKKGEEIQLAIATRKQLQSSANGNKEDNELNERNDLLESDTIVAFLLDNEEKEEAPKEEPLRWRVLATISKKDFIKMGGQLADVTWQIDLPKDGINYFSFFKPSVDRNEGYTRLFNYGYSSPNSKTKTKISLKPVRIIPDSNKPVNTNDIAPFATEKAVLDAVNALSETKKAQFHGTIMRKT